jgi:hypothetical protein
MLDTGAMAIDTLVKRLSLPLSNCRTIEIQRRNKKRMNRLSLPILAVLASAMTLPPSTFAQVERATLELPASSSSSTPDMSAANDKSSLAVQSAPASKPSDDRGGARPFSGIGVGVKVGVSGIGFDVATPLIRQRLNLRGGGSFITYSPSTITTDSLNIDGTIKFQNADVTLDYFPFHGWFRLSGGITVFNNTGVTANLTIPTGQSFSVGDTTYYSEPYNAATNPAGPITGSGVFTFGDSNIAPRVSIGTGNLIPRKGRFTFQSEIGFQYLSAPSVVYTLKGTGCQNYSNGVYSNCGTISQTDVNAQEVTIQNDLNELRFFPILSIGLGFRIH